MKEFDIFECYNRHIINADALKPVLITVSDMGCLSSTNFYCRRKIFENNVMFFAIEGKFHVEQYDKKITYSKGEGMIMSFKRPHYYYTDKVDILKAIWFHFKGSAVEPILNILEQNNLLPLKFSGQDGIELYTKIHHLTTDCPDGYEYEVSKLVYEFILEVAKPYLQQISLQNDVPRNMFMENVSRYMEAHICEKISYEQLTSFFGYNSNYFNRLFRRYFDKSPHQYMLEHKLKYSKKLLKENKLSLSEIADFLSFSDQSHYSKSFKLMFNITPSKYRSMNNESKRKK